MNYSVVTTVLESNTIRYTNIQFCYFCRTNNLASFVEQNGFVFILFLCV